MFFASGSVYINGCAVLMQSNFIKYVPLSFENIHFSISRCEEHPTHCIHCIGSECNNENNIVMLDTAILYFGVRFPLNCIRQRDVLCNFNFSPLEQHIHLRNKCNSSDRHIENILFISVFFFYLF